MPRVPQCLLCSRAALFFYHLHKSAAIDNKGLTPRFSDAASQYLCPICLLRRRNKTYWTRDGGSERQMETHRQQVPYSRPQWFRLSGLYNRVRSVPSRPQSEQQLQVCIHSRPQSFQLQLPVPRPAENCWFKRPLFHRVPVVPSVESFVCLCVCWSSICVTVLPCQTNRRCTLVPPSTRIDDATE